MKIHSANVTGLEWIYGVGGEEMKIPAGLPALPPSPFLERVKKGPNQEKPVLGIKQSHQDS